MLEFSCYGSYLLVLSIGEFQLRLRQLEKSLLQALNEAKGRILDDDSIITHLEKLKTEAADVAKKVEETDIVMAEVETTSQQYVPLAQSCSSIYFTLEALKQVQFMAQMAIGSVHISDFGTYYICVKSL